MTYLFAMTTPPSSLRSHGVTTSRRTISRIRRIGGGSRLLHPLWTFGSIMSLLLAVEALNVGDIVMIVHRLSCRGVAGRVGCCRIGAIDPLEVVASLERSESQAWRYTWSGLGLPHLKKARPSFGPGFLVMNCLAGRLQLQVGKVIVREGEV